MVDQLQDPGLPVHDVGFDSVPTSAQNIADSFSSHSTNVGHKHSGVFWAVNCFILFLIFLTVMWCCFVQRYVFSGTDRRLASDEFYRARLRRRRLRREERNEAPDKRQEKLHASFSRNRVQMTVKESDFIEKSSGGEGANDSSIKETTSAENLEGKDGQGGDDANNHTANDIEMGGNDTSFSSMDEESGLLKLGNGNTVPNCCAICLEPYEVGDVVVWSSNPKCIHAFHRECVTDWLIKMQPETPCPCCRQEFTDLEEIRKEHKIKWLPTFAFDINSIRFR